MEVRVPPLFQCTVPAPFVIMLPPSGSQTDSSTAKKVWRSPKVRPLIILVVVTCKHDPLRILFTSSCALLRVPSLPCGLDSAPIAGKFKSTRRGGKAYTLNSVTKKRRGRERVFEATFEAPRPYVAASMKRAAVPKAHRRAFTFSNKGRSNRACLPAGPRERDTKSRQT